MSAIASLHKSERVLLWFVCNALLTGSVAWVAFQVQQNEIAPAVLFPILVGASLGAIGSQIRLRTGVPGLRWALVGAAASGLLVVVGQDYIGHRHRLRLYEREMQRISPLSSVAVAEPPELQPRFDKFLEGVVREHPVWWCLDLLLTSSASLVVTAFRLSPKRNTT